MYIKSKPPKDHSAIEKYVYSMVSDMLLLMNVFYVMLYRSRITDLLSSFHYVKLQYLEVVL